MIRVNPYCRDYGWLFEDLKASLAITDAPGVQVIPSSDPLPNMDVYIALRTDEALDSPWREKTIVQWHDYREHPSVWQQIGEFAALQTVCPRQEIEGIATYCCPIGARRFFSARSKLPERFTLGWVGRDVVHRGRHIKHPEVFVQIIQDLRLSGVDVQASFYGPAFGPGNLADYASAVNGRLAAGDRAHTLERFYHGLDVLISTTEPEPGPLSIYEALRCGVPVISTPTGATYNKRPGLAERTFDELAGEARGRARQRYTSHALTPHVRYGVQGLTQEAWCRFTLELAQEVAG